MIENLILPDEQDLLDAHNLSLERFGGDPGNRDPEALQAALARPLQILAYSEEAQVTVYRAAVALGFGIAKIRHPFVDGNKRSGFDAILIVLGLNNTYLDAAERDAERMMVGVSSGSVSEEDLVAWVTNNSYAFDEANDPFAEAPGD